MKLLMFYAPSFWFKTFEKALCQAPDAEAESELRQVVVAFYQAEAEDEDRQDKVVAKLVKNLKWLTGKFETKTVLLHSFNHLSSSKAAPEAAQAMIAETRARLERSGFEVHETPFGYLNEWKMHVAGPSLAKVFKEL